MDSVFSTEEEMRHWIISTGKENRLVIAIKASELQAKNQKPRIRFGCEWGGKYRKFVNKNKSIGKEVNEKGMKSIPRATGSKKRECPFELRCLKELDGWTVKVFNVNHNHSPADQLEGHPYLGRLSSEQTTMLVDMCISSLSKPREILSVMKGKDEFNNTTIKSIYNACHKHRVKERAKKSQI